MIGAITLLLVCQQIGTIIAHADGWPIPGPILGLVLLLGLLIIRRVPHASMQMTSQSLLRNLGQLFVPAGAGIVNELSVLRANALAIAIAIPASTLLALGVTSVLMQLLARSGNRVPSAGERNRRSVWQPRDQVERAGDGHSLTDKHRYRIGRHRERARYKIGSVNGTDGRSSKTQ